MAIVDVHAYECYRYNQMADLTPLKKWLFAEIRLYESETINLSDTELNKLIFHMSDSLRLSLSGYIIIKKKFTAYSFEIPITILSKHHRALSKMEFPYALRRKRLILFSDMDASMITLQGGVEGFLEMYSQQD